MIPSHHSFLKFFFKTTQKREVCWMSIIVKLPDPKKRGRDILSLLQRKRQICSYNNLSVHLLTHPLIYPSIHASVHPSIHPFTHTLISFNKYLLSTNSMLILCQALRGRKIIETKSLCLPGAHSAERKEGRQATCSHARASEVQGLDQVLCLRRLESFTECLLLRIPCSYCVQPLSAFVHQTKDGHCQGSVSTEAPAESWGWSLSDL